MLFFFLKIVFLPGNHKRSAGEIRCDPPTVGRKGVLGVGTRETQMWQEHDFCRRIVRDLFTWCSGNTKNSWQAGVERWVEGNGGQIECQMKELEFRGWRQMVWKYLLRLRGAAIEGFREEQP